MTEQSLTITYTAPTAEAIRPKVRLEQQAVSSNRLTLTDLATMLSLVSSGVSAQTYQRRDCEAWIEGNQVHADLTVYAWPNAMDLEYELAGDLVVPGAARRIEMEREFDLVVGMTDQVQLPFLVRSAKLEWQTPCYNEFGETVSRPTIRIEGDQLHLDAVVFGVLRFRGLALGYQHTLRFSMGKSGAVSITNLKPALTALWMDGDEQQTQWLSLDLPGCLEALLAACDDGSLLHDRVFLDVTFEEKPVPHIYYNTCSGKVLEIRYERL